MFDSFDSKDNDFLFPVRAKPSLFKPDFQIYRGTRRKTNQVCPFFLENKCVLGLSCFYQHEPKAKAKPPRKDSHPKENQNTVNKARVTPQRHPKQAQTHKNISELEKEPTTKNNKSKIHSNSIRPIKKATKAKNKINKNSSEIGIEEPENRKRRFWEGLAIESMENRFRRKKSRRNLSQEKLSILCRAELTFSRDQFQQILRGSSRRIGQTSGLQESDTQEQRGLDQLRPESVQLSLILSDSANSSCGEASQAAGQSETSDQSLSSLDHSFY